MMTRTYLPTCLSNGDTDISPNLPKGDTDISPNLSL